MCLYRHRTGGIFPCRLPGSFGKLLLDGWLYLHAFRSGSAGDQLFHRRMVALQRLLVQCRPQFLASHMDGLYETV